VKPKLSISNVNAILIPTPEEYRSSIVVVSVTAGLCHELGGNGESDRRGGEREREKERERERALLGTISIREYGGR